MKGTIDRLVGDDGEILSLTESDVEIVGDGVRKLSELHPEMNVVDGSEYIIIAKAKTSSKLKSFIVGDLYHSARGEDILAEGDTLKYLIPEKMADAKNVSINIASSEIDVTVMTDNVTKYRKGKGDASGSIAMQVMISQMQVNPVYNQFFKIVKDASDGSRTISSVRSKSLYLKTFLQKQGNGETQVFLLAQVELFGITLGADSGSAQEYSSNIRFTGNDPILYIKETDVVEEDLKSVEITPKSVADAKVNSPITFTATPNVSDGVTYAWTGTNVAFDKTNENVAKATPQSAAECVVKCTVTKNRASVYDEVTFTAEEVSTAAVTFRG